MGACLADLAARGEAEHLISPAVGEDRPVPADEAMQPPAPRDEPFAGPQVQVIRVAQDDLRAGVDQLSMRQRLDCPLCPNRHEDRRVDDSVSSVQPPAARRAVGGDEIEAHKLARDR